MSPEVVGVPGLATALLGVVGLQARHERRVTRKFAAPERTLYEGGPMHDLGRFNCRGDYQWTDSDGRVHKIPAETFTQPRTRTCTSDERAEAFARDPDHPERP